MRMLDKRLQYPRALGEASQQATRRNLGNVAILNDGR